MISFEIPKNLNGAELIEELAAAGIETGIPTIESGLLWLDISASQESKAAAIVKSHNGNVIPNEPTIEEKLASVGLTVKDLKIALGL